ncbi:DNase I-like protein, partial [Cubamyces sp. BRFM 1775]
MAARPEASAGHVHNNGGEVRRKEKKRSMKAHLRIATLNMRGYGLGGSQSTPGQVSEKWLLMNQIMREKRIAIMAVQEAHLDDERAGTLKRIFEETMEIVYSADPDNGTAARGVAFVINKRIVKQPKYEYRVVREGRVLLLDLEWSITKRLRLLNVYAPNDMTKNMEMWEELMTANVGRVDIALGDMNVVEDPMDRLPPREDHEGARNALKRWTAARNLVDGWRRSNVDVKAFTYMHASNGHQSRLDRIYLKARLEKDADNWEMAESGIKTDHKLVWVDVTDREAPFVGKGRWAMPKHLLTDEKMKKTMKELAKKMVSEMEAMGERTTERNAQTVYHAFKASLVAAARARAKEKIPKMQKRIDRLKDDLHATLNPNGQPNCETEEEMEKRIAHAAILQERLEKLKQRRFEGARRTTAARHNITNETLTKRWTRA